REVVALQSLEQRLLDLRALGDRRELNRLGFTPLAQSAAKTLRHAAQVARVTTWPRHFKLERLLDLRLDSVGTMTDMREMNHILPAGTPAPDFSLHATPDQLVSLSDFRGRPVVLAFYPADWSPVCGDQMSLYNELLEEFARFDAELLGISVDGAWCHIAFAHERKLRFPLLADFEPKGSVARLYGAYREHDGTTERALFVIDADG